MKKVELLSPAGNKEMFYEAINNGADAVYLSGKNYGARKFAENFTDEELIEAINYAHIYGVKVYVTVNTLIYETEIEEFLKYIGFLYINRVDAVIMQDLGMISVVRKLYPNLEVHASTQAHNHNSEGLKLFKKLGVKRVVLARELSIDEIKKIDVNIEKEVFVYGALCISYSGCCLISSLLLNRSGNRGMCAGMCRLCYELYEENKKINTDGNYLLSPKELNALPKLRDIIESGVDSLKIEGRMKSPEYVAYVTKLFRRLIDNYYNHEEMNLTEEENNNLKKLYNRDFTLGHLFNEKNYKLMNIKSPNHVGTHLGTAIVYKNKIKILLADDISQGDGIRFNNKEGMIVNYLYDKDMLLVNSAKKGDIVYVDNKFGLKTINSVLKTLDVKLHEHIKDVSKRKVNVDIKVIAKLNKPLKATITDGNNIITKEIGLIEKSKNYPVTKEDLVDRFSKLNDTPFRLKDIVVDADNNIFIQVKLMNELRRILVEKLIEKRIGEKRAGSVYNIMNNNINIAVTNEYSFYIKNEEQLKFLLNYKVCIYTDNYELYQKYKSDNIYYVTNRVSSNLKNLNQENIVASNLSSVYKYYQNNKVLTNIYLNVTNSSTLKLLHDLNVSKVSLSVENDIDTIREIIKGFTNNYNLRPNVEVLVYGKVELMVLKHCYLNMFTNKDQKCNLCQKNKKYFLKDRNNNKFPIITKDCKSYILNSNNIDLISKINEYKKVGVTNFSIYLYDEDALEIDSILKRLKIKS